MLSREKKNCLKWLNKEYCLFKPWLGEKHFQCPRFLKLISHLRWFVPTPTPPTPIPRGVSIQSCMISCFHHNRVLPCPVPVLAHPAHRSTALRHFLDHTVSDSDGQDLNLSPLGGSGRSPKTVLAFESQCAAEPRLGTSQLAQLSPLSASCSCPHTEDSPVSL